MDKSKNSLSFKVLLLVAGLCAALGQAAAFAAEAGKFQFVAGDIKVRSADGKERAPVKGEVFNAGETIITGATGSAQIRMSDGGLVAVRPDTEMKLDQYVFNGREDGSERKIVSLIKGGFRAITGLIGNRNKENYKILTPSATIGIRGTDHEPVVVPPGVKGGFQAGTYDRVYRGATIIETDKGKLIVNPNQVGFTPGKGAAPVLLPKVPDFYNKAPASPDVAKDPQKDTKSDDSGDTKSTDAKSSARPLSSSLKSDALSTKESDATSSTASRLSTPLDSSAVKDIGTTLKSDVLTTPLTDTRSTLSTTTLRDTTSTLKDTSTPTLKTDALTAPVTVPTTTIRSTEVLTAPVTTTSTLKTPITTTVTTPTTTVAPTTVIAPKTEAVTIPTTTIRSTITKP